MKAKVINNEVEVKAAEQEIVEVPEEAMTEVVEEAKEAKKPGIAKRMAGAVVNGVKDGASYLWHHKKAVATGAVMTMGGLLLASVLNSGDKPIEGECCEVVSEDYQPVDEPVSDMNEE